MKILFICSGNVGRSQMAEAFYNSFTGSQDAASAGCDPAMPAKWERPAPEAIAVMREEGIDISVQRVKTVTALMAAEADRIVILCGRWECPPFVLRHQAVSFWDVEDPHQASLETFRRVRDEIKRQVLTLLQGRS